MKAQYEAVVIGASSGGLAALSAIIPFLPADFMPVIVVQHMAEDADNYLPMYLQSLSKMHVKEAESNEAVVHGNVYIAAPGYHLLIEPDRTLSFSIDEKICFARPSIDVLFESAADIYQNTLIGIILTGANADGTQGMKQIKNNGGLTIAQDPATADAPYMPASAIAIINIDLVLPLAEIKNTLLALAASDNLRHETRG